MITAPFNFVPLNKEVFYPSWSDEISFDKPLDESLSGEIEIKITALSPIFIRDSQNEERFCNYNGQFFIPGSSVRGMVRNVLEIMSFAKLKLFSDKTYAVRDLNNKTVYRDRMDLNKIECGWLYIDKDDRDKLKVECCKIPGRIDSDEIGQYKKTPNAKGKYESFNGDLEGYFEGIRKIYKRSSKGKKGTIVFTGHVPNKKYEFIFFKQENPEILEISNDVFEKFKFAYFDGRKTEPKESIDWKYWKEKLYNGEKIPIFFHRENGKIKHFGLSYLYKLPYNHSIKDGIKQHFKNQADLVESIFGFVGEKYYGFSDEALKSRVQFSHFFARNARELDRRSEVLGTPRASYYPIYIKQDGRVYVTFMDDFIIAGRKRYPIHKSNEPTTTPDTGNDSVRTTFIPLDKDVEFIGKLRFFNLKKAELGALLSALTFHNTKGCYHNIGMGKPLGYGKIKIDVKCDKLEEYLKEFELQMEAQIPNWAKTEQLKELFTMATEQDNTGSSRLEYMDLKDFAKEKNDINYLKSYSELDNIKSVYPKSLINESDKDKIEKIRKENEQKQKYIDEKIKKEQNNKKLKAQYQNEIKNIENLSIEALRSFIKKFENCDFADVNDINYAKNKIKEYEKLKELELKRKEEEKLKNDWEKVLKADKKYKKDAINRFLQKYPNSIYTKEAKDLLDSLKKNENQKPKYLLKYLDNVDSVKQLKKILMNLENVNLNELEEKLVQVYERMKSKQRKKFFKEIKLKNLFGEEFENRFKQKVLK